MIPEAIQEEIRKFLFLLETMADNCKDFSDAYDTGYLAYQIKKLVEGEFTL